MIFLNANSSYCEIYTLKYKEYQNALRRAVSFKFSSQRDWACCKCLSFVLPTRTCQLCQIFISFHEKQPYIKMFQCQFLIGILEI